MIELKLTVKGELIKVEFEERASTLQENSMIVRELERIKFELLTNFEYKDKLYISKEDEE